jgi:small GTP-binding protein
MFALQAAAPPVEETPPAHYSNAKVVLVGEHSTGKSCLARALMKEPFAPQPATHGMNVWHYSSQSGQDNVTREVFLWDLAGQADYQLIHQLFLEQTALALVVFDSSNHDELFTGVERWQKALARVGGSACRKLLVAGMVDRGSPPLTAPEIDEYCKSNGFDSYVATSALTGQGISELARRIDSAIPWNELPVTTSPALWRELRQFLLDAREKGNPLLRKSELLSSFAQRSGGTEPPAEDFDTVLKHAQTQGLVWSLSFGDLVLLRPELLNAYASALVRVARAEEYGLGCVSELDALKAKIDFHDLKRLDDTLSERALLHAVVELLIERELVFREDGKLVFPTKCNRTDPPADSNLRDEVAFRFSGSLENIHATLLVRLAYSQSFVLKAVYRTVVDFDSPRS